MIMYVYMSSLNQYPGNKHDMIHGEIKLTSKLDKDHQHYQEMFKY